MSFIIDVKNHLTEENIQGKYFIGTVVDNKDPKKANRIKVVCDGITEELNKDDLVSKLPWYVIRKEANKGANAQNDIPKLKSRVIVYFEEEDIMNGIVVGTYSSKPPSAG